MNKKTLLIAATLAFISFSIPASTVFAQENPDMNSAEEYYKARVIEIFTKDIENVPGYQQKIEVVRAEIKNWPEKGNVVEAENLTAQSQNSQNSDATKIEPGDTIIVVKTNNFGETLYYVADKYRLTPLIVVLALFFATAIFFGRLRGLTSVLGLGFSILILALFIVPQILEGRNPLLITIVGAFGIAVISIYLAHGFKKRTGVALVSTLITLAVAAGLSVAFVFFAKLFGFGSEEAFYLQGFPGISVDMRGLLIGAIIIGTLGVLDDVTTSQTAAVEEISKANPRLSVKELYKRGLSVGHEHIAALINTLALAYAGASLPLFLLFTLNETQPLWIILNSEMVAEEIIRTLVGSVSLVFAVPISTILAARFLRVPDPES